MIIFYFNNFYKMRFYKFIPLLSTSLLNFNYCDNIDDVMIKKYNDIKNSKNLNNIDTSILFCKEKTNFLRKYILNKQILMSNDIQDLNKIIDYYDNKNNNQLIFKCKNDNDELPEILNLLTIKNKYFVDNLKIKNYSNLDLFIRIASQSKINENIVFKKIIEHKNLIDNNIFTQISTLYNISNFLKYYEYENIKDLKLLNFLNSNFNIDYKIFLSNILNLNENIIFDYYVKNYKFLNTNIIYFLKEIYKLNLQNKVEDYNNKNNIFNQLNLEFTDILQIVNDNEMDFMANYLSIKYISFLKNNYAKIKNIKYLDNIVLSYGKEYNIYLSNELNQTEDRIIDLLKKIKQQKLSTNDDISSVTIENIYTMIQNYKINKKNIYNEMSNCLKYGTYIWLSNIDEYAIDILSNVNKTHHIGYNEFPKNPKNFYLFLQQIIINKHKITFDKKILDYMTEPSMSENLKFKNTNTDKLLTFLFFFETEAKRKMKDTYTCDFNYDYLKQYDITNILTKKYTTTSYNKFDTFNFINILYNYDLTKMYNINEFINTELFMIVFIYAFFTYNDIDLINLFNIFESFNTNQFTNIYNNIYNYIKNNNIIMSKTQEEILYKIYLKN